MDVREGCRMKLFKWMFVATSVFALVPNLFARWVTQEEVMRAANATLAQPTFQTTFWGATIESVTSLDGLWCVQLAPKGYLIFSGSTKQMPLLVYATSNYVAPTKDKPAFQIQAGMRARAKRLECQLVATFFVSQTPPTPAEAAWEALLNPQSTLQLLAATVTNVTVDLASEELNSNWDQFEPWNDFCPQLAAETASEDTYRNRAPVGCAATMYSQIMKYYEWPQRIDAIYSKRLNTPPGLLKNEQGEAGYDMRFHGGLPIEWNALYDFYWKYIDEEGWEPQYTTEAERLPVARLGLLIDVLSDMTFDSVDNNGSGTSLLNVVVNDWYDLGEMSGKESGEAFSAEQLAEIKEVLESGMPLPASIPGHAVFICGYQVKNKETYLKVNDGYVNEKNDDTSGWFCLADEAQLDLWVLGHSPKAQVQVAPLPKVVNVNDLPSVVWMVPECREEDFTQFTVTATPYSSESVVESITLDQSEDSTADEEVFGSATLRDEMGQETAALTVTSSAYDVEVYTFPEAFIPSQESTLSFAITDLRGDEKPFECAVNVQLWNEIEMAWETLATFPEADAVEQAVLPDALEISLADYAERFCRLRLTLSSMDEEGDEEEGNEEADAEESTDEEARLHYGLSNIMLTNVYQQGTSTAKTFEGKNVGVRELQLSSLGLTTEFGSRYRIVVSGKADEPVWFGETFTRLTEEPVSMPIIGSVTQVSGEALEDGVLLEGDLKGRAGLRVTCNEAVTEVRALSSCLSLIADEDITVYRYDEHVFDVIIDSSQTHEGLDGSRMLITLEARTAQGNVVYRDVTFALRAATKSIEYTEPVVIEWEVDEDSLAIPHYWFRKYDLADVTTSADALKALAEVDSDKDGLLNWQEFLCGTSPIDDADKLQIKNLVFDETGALKDVEYTPMLAEQGVIHLEGKASLTDPAWQTIDLATHRFFRLRVTVKE